LGVRQTDSVDPWTVDKRLMGTGGRQNSACPPSQSDRQTYTDLKLINVLIGQTKSRTQASKRDGSNCQTDRQSRKT